jgi:hypothetical protein
VQLAAAQGSVHEPVVLEIRATYYAIHATSPLDAEAGDGNETQAQTKRPAGWDPPGANLAAK